MSKICKIILSADVFTAKLTIMKHSTVECLQTASFNYFLDILLNKLWHRPNECFYFFGPSMHLKKEALKCYSTFSFTLVVVTYPFCNWIAWLLQGALFLVLLLLSLRIQYWSCIKVEGVHLPFSSCRSSSKKSLSNCSKEGKSITFLSLISQVANKNEHLPFNFEFTSFCACLT